ncbi:MULTISPECIES: diacylglycerol kinase family protein [Aerococcus]|nr:MULTISPECIES: diacylglycerol kinase family protein [Aerococcus]MDK6369752.1 diacylglycerol kinase family protein [Aerococcus sp. UMB9870]MDK6687111.1 diacylglycerol kinase family protein [Aerococcus sp. UMB8623]MDK6940330.1 diacylglycerol kinase family protein [Aerococcus sp. UMB8487]OFK13424.1 hypothetical protein HMPREF2829_01995 [Aerococcus sp. HMSC072A12]OFR35562.1 hypothetical protein HMPREF2892_00675 [Aerococcus sp. HMSC061A03]
MHIICNPQSGMGRGRKRLNEVTTYLESLGTDYQTYLTQYPGHMAELVATSLAHLKAEDRLILVGGDGSLHDLVNALADQDLAYPIAFIPAGTGNDFSRYYQAGKESIEDLLAPMFAGRVRQVELGQILLTSDYSEVNFVNSLGFGLDGQVIHESEVLKARGGLWQWSWANRLRYLLGVFRSLTKLPDFRLELELAGQHQVFSRVTLLTLMLNPYFGGGIQLDPRVTELEGEFAVLVIHDLDWQAIPGLLYQILWRKDQGNSKYLAFYHGPTCTLNLTPNIPGQVDGEAIFSLDGSLNCRLAQQAFYL